MQVPHCLSALVRCSQVLLSIRNWKFRLAIWDVHKLFPFSYNDNFLSGSTI